MNASAGKAAKGGHASVLYWSVLGYQGRQKTSLRSLLVLRASSSATAAVDDPLKRYLVVGDDLSYVHNFGFVGIETRKRDEIQNSGIAQWDEVNV